MRRVEADEQQERVQSDADRLDGKLTDWIGQRLTLLGDSASLRARAQREYIAPLQNAVVDRVHKAYDYDEIETDYQFNLNCLRALLRLFRSRGSQVICYLAPQRSDVPPLLDPAGEQKFNELLRREAETLGVVVLDARHVVLNEYWGWEGASPDRSHFTEPGHQHLAQFLADEIENRHLWPPQPQSHAR
jgi:lysophospholipase L1-like esterase